MKSLFLLSLLFFLHSCGDIEPESLFTCPSSESHFGNTNHYTIASNQKIAQEVTVNGKVGASVYANKIQFQMDSSNLTEIKLEVYRDKEGGHLHTPDDGTLLGTVVVNSGLGSSDVETVIDFDFSSAIPFEVGKTYYFILTPTGGSFNIPYVTPSSISSTSISRYSPSSWSSLSDSDTNVSFKIWFERCEGI